MGLEKQYSFIKNQIPDSVELIVVSKTQPIEKIQTVYNLGQKAFGENKVQELTDKAPKLPNDIEWHLIGHLQTNKVKYIAEFVHLIHAVDSLKLLKEINKQAQKHNRIIPCLMQVKIAKEESKFGLSLNQLKDILNSEEVKTFTHIKIVGLMGMATFTEDQNQIKEEFSFLSKCYNQLKVEHKDFQYLSMGMSGDYNLAIENGSNMLRIGSSIFGVRE